MHFNFIRSTYKILDSIKNKVIETYQTAKKETIKFFNGKKIHTIFFSDKDLGPSSGNETMIPLPEYIAELKRTIESSKIFMREIIDKIRYQGKIKIINELNNNPTHPEYQSSFPDLLTIIPKKNDEDNFYTSTRLDENFDLEGRKSILQIDNNFRERMNKSVQQSYYEDFIFDNSSWEVSDQLNSLKNIKNTIEYFQECYENAKFSQNLDEKFMEDIHSSLFIVNNNIIVPNNRDKMIQDFQKIIPDINSQKLIATYANQKFLYQSYLQLISEHPEIEQYWIKNSRNMYKIDNLDDGSIKLVITNLSDLDVKNKNYIKKYKSLGIRATIVIYPNDLPIIKYSHFMK